MRCRSRPHIATALERKPGIVLALRAARAWGVPPTEYLKAWSTRDRALAEGLWLYEAGMGPHGIPMLRATDPDADGWYEVDARQTRTGGVPRGA